LFIIFRQEAIKRVIGINCIIDIVHVKGENRVELIFVLSLGLSILTIILAIMSNWKYHSVIVVVAGVLLWFAILGIAE
jgi:hypothetical protein